MPSPHARTEILLSPDTLAHLRSRHVLIAGLGGVGGIAAEIIVRAGIGRVTIMDGDVVATSNLNRQLVALHSTIGQRKVDIMQARLRDINPELELHLIDEFMTTDMAKEVVNSADFDYVADCIDTLACKAQLILEAQRAEIPIISSMGAGNRIDASMAQVSKLNRTQNCRLARVIRKRLRELGGSLRFPVVYSPEPARPVITNAPADNYTEKATNGTIAQLPMMFGVLLGGEIVKHFITEYEQRDDR